MSKPKTTASDYKLILGLRRITEGSFAGLWELVELNHGGAVARVITDANSKALVCSLASNEIARCL